MKEDLQNFLFQKGYIEVGTVTDKIGEIGTAFKQLGEDELYVFMDYDNSNQVILLVLEDSHYDGNFGKYQTNHVALSEVELNNDLTKNLYHDEIQ